MKNVVKVGKRYQVVIPKEAREQLGINVEDKLIVSVRNAQIIMQPKPQRYSEYMQGLGKKVWREIEATEYVRKEREAWGK
ncbi:MAG: AbrB/MazE/SpoVT family DNA-binding domain-containing protein [Dehalococcoidia bacterium]|nr:AbrB/MazE/SpoVT family DNA-binding domain-containing protein [Dehalococcoidia bacterium]